MTNLVCNVLIIGAGPAGLSTALNLTNNGIDDVLIVDCGIEFSQRILEKRLSLLSNNVGACNTISGVGGASGINGGKLCFFPAGERLAKHCDFSNTGANELVMRFLLQEKLLEFKEDFIPSSTYKNGNLLLKIYPVTKLLTQDIRTFFLNIVNKIESHQTRIISGITVDEIESNKNGFKFFVKCTNNDGESISICVNESIVISTGRSGAGWFEKVKGKLGILSEQTTVDYGLRFNFGSDLLFQLPNTVQDPKFVLNQMSQNEVRTLCWCRGGMITNVKVEGQTLIDGHFGQTDSKNTGVSIVARSLVPLGSNPFLYAKSHFSKDLLINSPYVMTIREFLFGRISSSKPESFPYNHSNLRNHIAESLNHKIENLFFEIDNYLNRGLTNSYSGFVYGPVIDNFWGNPFLDKNLMSSFEDIYISGDSTGLARGIIQSIFSGLIVSNSIIEKNGILFQPDIEKIETSI